jgi:aspartyl protease family protein
MRNLIMISGFVGLAASVPILYQANPEAVHRMVKQAANDQPAAEVKSVSAPAAIAEATLGRKVRLSQDDRGHFFGEFRINGKRTDAMVDTGATLVALNESTARRVGLSVLESDYKHEVSTANGKTRAAVVMLRTLQVGRIQLHDVEAVVLGDKALKNTLVGMSFLKRLNKVAVEGGEMILEQ